MVTLASLMPSKWYWSSPQERTTQKWIPSCCLTFIALTRPARYFPRKNRDEWVAWKTSAQAASVNHDYFVMLEKLHCRRLDFCQTYHEVSCWTEFDPYSIPIAYRFIQNAWPVLPHDWQPPCGKPTLGPLCRGGSSPQMWSSALGCQPGWGHIVVVIIQICH